ncbi:MAG: ferritin family protein [Proteobacteria bacterium]|nr:ferritin family protein [Pseudomonadota bacterium]
MRFENLKAIIDFAIEKEKEAADFYDEVSEKEPFSGSKKMLKEFADEERKHQAMLEKFMEKGVDQSVVEYKLKWIQDIKRSDYVVDMEYKEGMGYTELLMLAMKREEKALKLYNELEKEVEDAEGKKLFQVLAQEEAKHKLFLETTYDDYMAEMGD